MFLTGKKSLSISISVNMDFLHFKNCCIVFHRMHYEIVTPLVEIQGCFSLKEKKKERKLFNKILQGTILYMPPRTHVAVFLLGQYQEVG